MAFYHPSESRFSRHYREEVEMAFSSMDCVLNGEQAIYCSSELTTGIRLYEVLRQHRLESATELKRTMGQPWFEANIFQVNMHAASEFARSVRNAQPDRSMVITPAPFIAPGWTQPEYLGFWETLIRTRVKAVSFNQNWEFSNGCSFEFAVALDAGVPTFDQLGRPLGRKQGIGYLEGAIARLSSQGFDTVSLLESLQRLLVAA
jgi:hypothetical protein